MPFAGGIVCGDAHFFRQRAELSLNIPAEASCPVSNLFPVWICLAGFMLLFLTYFLSDKYRIHWLYGVSVFLCCFGLGAGMTEEYLHRTDFPFSDEAAVYQVILLEKPEMKERSVLCHVQLEGKVNDEDLQKSEYGRTFLFYFPRNSATVALKRGDRLWVHTRITPPVNNGNPDEFDYVRYLTRKAGTGTAYISAGHWRIIGHDTSRFLRQIALDYREKVVELYHRLGFQGDNLAVLSALTVGDKENLSEDMRETYSIAGASHVLALSGLHIGLLSTLFLFFFSFLWKRWAAFKPLGFFLVILFLWAFAFLTGLSSSVVRSVIMFSLLVVSRLQSEKLLSLNTLAATAFLMLLYNPLWLFDVGFQLSFVAVVSILLIQPKLYSLLSVRRFRCCANRYGSFSYILFLPFLYSFSADKFMGDSYGDVDFVFCGSYACPDSFFFPSIWLCFRGRCSAKCSEQSSLLDRRTANVLYRSALDRSLGDYAVLSFSIVSVSEFGYPNCSQHILSALLPVVADHLSYDFRQPVFSSARHCFL